MSRRGTRFSPPMRPTLSTTILSPCSRRRHKDMSAIYSSPILHGPRAANTKYASRILIISDVFYVPPNFAPQVSTQQSVPRIIGDTLLRGARAESLVLSCRRLLPVPARGRGFSPRNFREIPFRRSRLVRPTLLFEQSYDIRYCATPQRYCMYPPVPADRMIRFKALLLQINLVGRLQTTRVPACDHYM